MAGGESKRLEKLPGWAVDNRTSVLREVEQYRDMPRTRKIELSRMACSTGVRLLVLNKHRDRVIEYQDPLPESSARALQRLRSEHGWPRG